METAQTAVAQLRGQLAPEHSLASRRKDMTGERIIGGRDWRRRQERRRRTEEIFRALPRHEEREGPHCATEGRTTGKGGAEHEREHALGVPDGQLLRNQAAHRCAINVRARHPGGVHDRGDVVRHLLDTESLIGGVGQARAAVIKTQNAKPPQLGQQVVPEGQVERGPRD